MQIALRDFRCFKDIRAPLHALTVFIGENDAGKTALVDSLECLLTPVPFNPNNVRRTTEDASPNAYEIEGAFSVDAGDAPPPEWVSSANVVRVRKVFQEERIIVQVYGRGPSETQYRDFASRSAEQQKAALLAVGIVPGSNASSRKEQLEDAIKGGVVPVTEQWIDVPFGHIAPHLPRFERVASAEYRQPDALISRVAQAVVADALSPRIPGSDQRQSVASLAPVATLITSALQRTSDLLTDFLAHHNSAIKRVSITPRIDFSKSMVSASLYVDTGTGLSSLTTHGEGSKKRLWMGLLEWEKATSVQIASLATVRAYDEPDVNLDYTAERELFAAIMEATHAAGSRVQSVVCTHAMTLVDRASADSINLIRVGNDDHRSIDFLSSDGDSDLAAFLNAIGETVGVSNSSLFYERAFLLVEGESEEIAIPILYRALFGRSMREDGLVLVNLYSCGAWKSVLKVFLKNRSDLTVILMDEDCRSPGSSGYMTAEHLSSIGYSPAFLTSSCFYVGHKEFEDAFATSDIVATLNNHWPKAELPWNDNEIARLKLASGKFSEDLMTTIRSSCAPQHRSDARKPIFAARLAEQCKCPAQVPQAIRDFLTRGRDKAGL